MLVITELSGPLPPPCRWLVEGLIPAFGITAVASAPGVGKTVVAANLAVAVGSGGRFLGRQVERGGVVFLTAEARDSTHRRLVALGGRDLPIVIASGDIDLCRDNAAEEILDALRRSSERIGQNVTLLVIDALGSATRGMDENSVKDVSRAMGTLATVSEKAGVAILLLAHTSKAGTDGRIRGHSSIEADVEASFAISRRGKTRELSAVKHRHAADIEPIGFQIDEDGERLGLRLVEIEEEPAGSAEERRQAAILDHLFRVGGKVERRALLSALADSQVVQRGEGGGELLRQSLTALERDGRVRREDRGRVVVLLQS